VQWLCNTANISSAKDLPFHEDGNSHQYVLSDQYRLLVSSNCSQEFVNTQHSTVASCIWPLDHNGKKYNEHGQEDFYFQFSQCHLNFFLDHNVKILVLYPTETSKIWWWHNNCKKVFFTKEMFDKKIKHQYSELQWLTESNPIARAKLQLNYYQNRTWFKLLLRHFKCTDAGQFSLGQLRASMGWALHKETYDYVSHWQLLISKFPNIKFISLDQLRDQSTDTVLDIFQYFNIQSDLPLNFILDQWRPLQTTMHRDVLHETIINCIVNGQAYDWSDTAFDLFDEAYLLYVLKFQHGIDLTAHTIEKLPTNTQDLLQLAS
jgi:hypothetical protein